MSNEPELSYLSSQYKKKQGQSEDIFCYVAYCHEPTHLDEQPDPTSRLHWH